MGDILDPRFRPVSPTLEQRINGCAEQVAEIVRRLSPGDSLHVVRHEDTGKSYDSLITVTVKDFSNR